MTSPIPEKALTGHCSAIHNDILYVLSPDAFQSLSLKENATWSELPTGEAVTGSACVTAVPNGDESQAALYVIGGTSTNDTYGGMQRFFFSNQSWESLTPLTSDMKGRTNHSVAYLNDSAAILVYAGSQPQAPSTLSSQTFLIDADEPYDISAYTSTAPPANQPILLPWSSSSAVMLGGESTNLGIFTFSPADGWQALGTNLTTALDSGVRGTLVTGSDGSKVVQIYDASKSPNTVENLVLLGAGGVTATNGETVGTSSSSSSSSSRKRKRVTLSDWPTYNSTDAPSTARSDYGIASSSDGLVVISGDSDSNPINLFNQDTNSWVDNDAFFGTASSSTTSATSTSSSSVSKTSSTAAATSTEPAALANSTSSDTRRTLGIALGVLAGVALLMAAALLFMRRRKRNNKKANVYVDEKEADRLSFADRGASFMKEAGGSVAEFGAFHQPTDSQTSLAIFGGNYNDKGKDYGNHYNGPVSPIAQTQNAAPPSVFGNKNNDPHSSLMIIAGKFGDNRHSRNVKEKGSYDSTTRLVREPSPEAAVELAEISKKTNAAGIVRKPVNGSPRIGVTEAENASGLIAKKRSSGWSKYFAAPVDSQARQTSIMSQSQYSVGSPNPNGFTPPPGNNGLNKNLVAQRLSAVSKGRPSYKSSADDLAARGTSMDAARAQTAAFHTGNSFEPENEYLHGKNSFDSQNRRHSSESVSSRSSSVFYSGKDGEQTSESKWTTPVSQGMSAKPIRGNSGSTREIHVAGPSPRIGQLQGSESNGGFSRRPRAPSSTYSASIAPGRDSRMPLDVDSRFSTLGSAAAPATAEIPGPAARAAAKSSGGFFPHNKDASRLPPRKIGALHPGTLAAIKGADVNDQKSGPSQGYLEERARLMREREKQATDNLERERMEKEMQARQMQQQQGKGAKNESVMSGVSEYSWLNLNAQAAAQNATKK